MSVLHPPSLHNHKKSSRRHEGVYCPDRQTDKKLSVWIISPSSAVPRHAWASPKIRCGRHKETKCMSISHDGVGGVYTDDTFKVLERVKYTVHRSLLNNLPFCRSDAQSGKKGTQHRTNENSVATIRLERESRLHSHINERIK